MSSHAARLTEARAERDAARIVFDTRLAQIRDDLSVRGVGGRVADRLSEDARSAFDEVLDVASESKGIIAGTIAMVALWLMRHPIIAWIGGLAGEGEDDDENENSGAKVEKKRNDDE